MEKRFVGFYGPATKKAAWHLPAALGEFYSD